MRLFSTEAKVGVVIIAALLLLTALTFQVGEFRFGRKGYLIEAVFDTVSGLEEQAKVRLAGVLVGAVDRIFLKDGRAHVVLRLDEGVQVKEDSVVSIASIGILAEFYVDITAGSRQARVLAPGALVDGVELIDLNQLVARMAELSETAKTLAVSLNETFGGKDSTVDRLLVGIDGLVARVSGLVEENRRGVADAVAQVAGLARDSRALLAENRAELHGTIANLREFSASLNRRADELSGALTDAARELRQQVSKTGEEFRTQMTRTGEEVRGAVAGSRSDLETLMTSMRGAATRAERAAESLESILRKVDEGEGALGQLVNESTSLEGVERAVDQIGDIAEKINRGEGSIGRLVTDDKLVTSMETAVGSVNTYLTKADRMQFFLGYRGEYLADADALKNYVTIKLQPTRDKYYLFEVVDDPGGKRSVTETTTEFDRPEGSYTLVEREIVNEEDELTFSLQFAKRFGPFTFRGGLMESQGGLGLDFEPLGERFRVSFEGWDFGRDRGPRFKLSGRAQIYKDIYLTAGVDELYESDARSLFLGAGILFSDEDLRNLLTLSQIGGL